MPASCGLGRPCGRQEEVNPARWIAPAGFSSRISPNTKSTCTKSRCVTPLGGRTPFECWRVDRLPAIAPRGSSHARICRRIRSCVANCSSAISTAAPSGTSCRATDGKGEEAIVRFACPRVPRGQLRLPSGCVTVSPPVSALPGAGSAAVVAAARAGDAQRSCSSCSLRGRRRAAVSARADVATKTAPSGGLTRRKRAAFHDRPRCSRM